MEFNIIEIINREFHQQKEKILYIYLFIPSSGRTFCFILFFNLQPAIFILQSVFSTLQPGNPILQSAIITTIPHSTVTTTTTRTHTEQKHIRRKIKSLTEEISEPSLNLLHDNEFRRKNKNRGKGGKLNLSKARRRKGFDTCFCHR